MMTIPRRLSVLLLGLVALTIHAPAWADSSWVDMPVQRGEDLDMALQRLNPCLAKDGSANPEAWKAMLRNNVERVDANGTFVLMGPTLHVPRAFAQAADRCARGVASEPAAAAPTAEEGHGTAVGEEKPASGEGHAEAHHEEGHGESHHEEAKEEEGPRRHLKVGATYEGAKVNVVSSGGVPISLTSKPRFGFEIDALEERNGWIYGAGFNWETAKFEEPDGRELTELNTTESAAELRIGHVWDEAIEVQLGLGASQVDRFWFPSDDELITSNDWMPRATLETKFNLFRSGSYFGYFSVGGALWVPFSGGRSVGVGEEAAFTIERRINSHFGIQISPHVGYERQETSDDTHSVFTYGVGVTFIGRDG